MEHTHSWFYYFYWILLHDCQGRPSRITFNVVLDVRSFLTTQEDGRTLHRASTNRCDIDASPHFTPTESFFPSVPRLLRHSSLMLTCDRAAFLPAREANRAEGSYLPLALFSLRIVTIRRFSFNICSFVSPQAARHCRYTRYFLFQCVCLRFANSALQRSSRR